MWTFIELPPFDTMREDLFNDDEYSQFQQDLMRDPKAGAVIPQTGGCRKIRWSRAGMGKRGGSRVVYFVRPSADVIVLVAGYTKGERDDVPRAWLRRLKEAFDHEQG